MKSEFGLVESFNIDNGELEGLTPQECFVLGYELADISRRAELVAEGFGGPVHACNQDRIAMALEKRGRSHQLGWCHDDASEGWRDLQVRPKDD